jgi:hypothetical protein
MVEAEDHLKLLSTSILDMYNVFEHIDMLSIGIQYQPYTVIPTLLLGSDFGVLGHFWSQNDVIMSWLRQTVTSNSKLLSTSTFEIYKVIEHIDVLSVGIWLQLYTVLPTLLGSDFGVLGHFWSQNDVITSGLMLTATSNCFLPPSQTFQSV